MFFASSAYHEYIIGVGFGYAVPVVTLFFAGIGRKLVIIILSILHESVVLTVCFYVHTIMYSYSCRAEV